MRAVLIAMWRLFHALFFYPVCIGLFIWVAITGKHWIYGAAIIAVILVFDPLWRVLGAQIFRWAARKRK